MPHDPTGPTPAATEIFRARIRARPRALAPLPEVSPVARKFPHGRSHKRTLATHRVIARRASRVPAGRNGRYLCMERKKTGRPSKGPRSRVESRIPVPLYEAAKTRADQRGMTLSDLVGELLAAEVGVPYQNQEGLPLNKAS